MWSAHILFSSVGGKKREVVHAENVEMVLLSDLTRTLYQQSADDMLNDRRPHQRPEDRCLGQGLLDRDARGADSGQRRPDPTSHAVEPATPASRPYPREKEPSRPARTIERSLASSFSSTIGATPGSKQPERTTRDDIPQDLPAPVVIPFETTVSVPRPGTVPSVLSSRTAHRFPVSRFRGWRCPIY